MLSADIVIATGVAYVGVLFVIAYFGDRHTRNNTASFLRSPAIYTLSISVYCTSWTFYGAVGNAARNGLEFLTIYLGPTIVFVGWWFLLRKLVHVSRSQAITSIADLLSSRFGKSNRLAVLVTIIAVVGITPYIALQLKAITSSIQAVAASGEGARGSLTGVDDGALALGVAAGMALFTIFFGTRNVDANEQHHGVVAAIAFEAVVKLIALLAVGFFVVFGLGGGFEAIYQKAAAAGVQIYAEGTFNSRWVAMIFLSAAAIVCLPRQFQITVVESAGPDHLRTAGWAFPAYLLLMSVFTMPIALYGLSSMPAGSNPDMFVLTIPLSAGQSALALLAFIGGFSSATSMIIVASIALSIMVSNHIIMPIVLKSASASGLGRRQGQGMTRLVLISRRVSIMLILALGFIYFRLTGDSDALAPIGLISFAGVAQFLPAMLAGLYWREATLKGVAAGIAVGFIVWGWTMLLPSFETVSPAVARILDEGPMGIGFLRPEHMFGLTEIDPLVHSVFWSILLNTAFLIIGSLFTTQSPLERIQAAIFVDVFKRRGQFQRNFVQGSATANDLYFVAERVLGARRATTLFETTARERGTEPSLLEPTSELVGRIERELAGSIGSASAHVMVSKAVAGGEVSLEEVMQMAGETQQVIEYSQELEKTSEALRLTALKLEAANAQLRKLDGQKNDFLSQVSHEVRTPMTSIRSFSEILSEPGSLEEGDRQRFASTIHQESLRLTKLLDEILDLGALERGQRLWETMPVDAELVLDRALSVCDVLLQQKGMRVEFGGRAKATRVAGDADRLSQVFINLLSNAVKYSDNPEPVLHIHSDVRAGHYVAEIADNGPGIDKSERAFIFEKFARGRQGLAGEAGAGLGLAISRQIVTGMGGTLDPVSGPLRGACFRLRLPLWNSAR